MEIRKPKFELGQKVIDKKGHVGNVTKVDSYHFDEDEYWYSVSSDGGAQGLYTEYYLEPYIEKPKSVWDLKDGDAYYVVDYDFMSVRSVIFFNDTDDLNYRYLGNCFLTKEEAESELERVKIEAEMLRLGGKRKAEQGKANWYLEYRPMSGGIEALWSSYEMDQGVIYYDSEEKAKKAVEIIGKDRIKKYIFGVDE